MLHLLVLPLDMSAWRAPDLQVMLPGAVVVPQTLEVIRDTGIVRRFPDHPSVTIRSCTGMSIPLPLRAGCQRICVEDTWHQ